MWTSVAEIDWQSVLPDVCPSPRRATGSECLPGVEVVMSLGRYNLPWYIHDVDPILFRDIFPNAAESQAFPVSVLVAVKSRVVGVTGLASQCSKALAKGMNETIFGQSMCSKGP